MTGSISPNLFLCKTVGLVFAVTISSCATEQVGENSERIVGLEHFGFGDRTSSAWVSDEFDGSKSRQFIGDTLHFEVEEKAEEGGWDLGVSHIDVSPAPVSTAKSEMYVCSSYSVDLTGPGRWRAGPKISVNWQGEESVRPNGDDWYENYIVEIASSSPQYLHDIFTGDYFKAEKLAPLVLADSTYRNYKIRFHDWWKFWSVRQDYRATGTPPIEPIVDTWIAHGLPTERQFDGVEANLETYGPIKGTGSLKVVTSDDPPGLTCENGSAK